MRIEENPSEFLDSIYCPSTVTLKDPQNMRIEDIKTLLSYIQARESAEGKTEAFRFNKYWNGTELCDAAYPPDALQETLEAGAATTGNGTSETPAAASVTLPEPYAANTNDRTSNANIMINQDSMSQLTALGFPTSIPI